MNAQTRARGRSLRIATDVLMENLDDDWSKPVVITDEMLSTAAKRIRRKPGDSTPNFATLRRWMENQAEYDGYLDELAVERATALHYAAWQGCTRLEREEVVRRLAHMPDPWGQGADVFTEGRRQGPGGAAMVLASPRAERFNGWPRAERKRMRDTVQSRRARTVSDAAAAAA